MIYISDMVDPGLSLLELDIHNTRTMQKNEGERLSALDEEARRKFLIKYFSKQYRFKEIQKKED